MAARGNGKGKAGIDDPRDIASAAADAVAEHEYWLQALHKALICGLAPGDSVLRDDAHLICRFGRWLKQHRAAGMLDDELFDGVEQAHAEIHEVARRMAAKATAAKRISAGEYEAFVTAMNGFRRLALDVETRYGGSDETPEDVDDGLAALQGRLTMLNELERERDRAVRTATPLCLMLVRPQGLDDIEGEYGRIGVDRTVIGMAARLFAQLRPYDAIYRHGQTEFLVCLPNATPEQARTVARRLAEAMAESSFPLSEKISVTLDARFGIAAADPRCAIQETLDHAVRAVDGMADEIGSAIRDRIAIWSPAS